jgi:hypothetical protein
MRRPQSRSKRSMAGNTSATIWISMPSSPVRSRRPTAGGGGAPRDRRGPTEGSRRFLDRAYVNSPSRSHGVQHEGGTNVRDHGAAPSSLACSRRPTSASTFAQKPSRALPARWTVRARRDRSLRSGGLRRLSSSRELHASGQRQRT